MEAILFFLIMMVAIMLLRRLQAASKKSFHNRPSFARDLPQHITVPELIVHAERFWSDAAIPLKELGRITACAGRSSFVYRDGKGRAHIICYTCAKKLLAAVYSDVKGTWPADPADEGGTNDASALDRAKQRLKTMWYDTNHFYIPTYRGGFRPVSAQLEDYAECQISLS